MRKNLVGSTIPSPHRRPEVKESTIGGSLISMLGTSQEGHQQSHAISEHLRHQRAQSSHGQSSHDRSVIQYAGPTLLSIFCCVLRRILISLLNSVQDEETSRVEARDATFAESTMALSHLLKCNMRQVTSADYLDQDVLEDMVPTDPQVRQDYWFDQCQSSHEESHLLGGGQYMGT
ncbi:hypothetical protein QL093DRAFT_2525295 [Fusarium oxysporum]|nr:hypothetical protein QL093DRAFT_2525295 [Fusarium oxysporum]